jgi:hypothetical protein
VKKILLGLASSLFVSFASANPVTIDLDGIAAGTDVSNAFSGVTLRQHRVVRDSEGDGVLVTENVYAVACPPTSNPEQSMCYPLGSSYFGAGYSESTMSIHCLFGDPNPCRWNPHRFLDVAFDFAVQEVTIDSTHRSDWPYAWAFDAAGNQLQVNLQITWHKLCGSSHPSSNYCHQTLTVTAVSGQISRVVFAGVGGTALLGKITYTIP